MFIITGPLAPKKGVPYRWQVSPMSYIHTLPIAFSLKPFSNRFNAVIPFLVVIIVTLVGMVLSGRQAILDMPAENR